MKLFFCAAIAASIYSTNGYSQVQGAVFSDNCKELEIKGVFPNDKLGKGGEKAVVHFKNYKVSLSETNENSSQDCMGIVSVKVPAGKQIKFHSATIEGASDLEGDSTGEVSLEYNIDLTGESGHKVTSINSGSSNTIFTEAKQPDPKFTACSTSDQIMNIELNLRASLRHRGAGSSIIELDNTDASKKVNPFICNWQWKSCTQVHFQKRIVSYNQMGSKRAYKVVVKLEGNKGRYKTSKGYFGELTDITYEDDGRIAKGKWSERGDNGWFKWTLIDEATGEFEGEFANSEAPKKIGSWWGYYDDASDDGR